jgi:hypothetical protein
MPMPLPLSWQTVVGSLQRVSPGVPLDGQQGSPGPPQPAHLPAVHMPNGWVPCMHICPEPMQVFCTQQPPLPHLFSPGQQGSPGPPQRRQASPPQIRPSPHFEGAQQGWPAPPQGPQVVPAQRRSAP